MLEMRRRRELCFSECSHQFFQIYYPHQCSHRLKIPPEFIRHFNGDLPYKSTITSPANRLWQVDVNKVDGDLFFCEDWQQFVQDNSLEFGDFLLFYYDGNSNFHVKIYGSNGCRKEVISILQDNQTVEPREAKRLECEASSKEIIERIMHPRDPMVIQGDDTDRTLEAARKFTSKFPFFKLVMTYAYVNNGVLHIPANFVKSYMGKGRRSVTLVVSDQSWPVKLIRYTRKIGGIFSAGWSVFSRENTLKAGDVCVFELIEINDFVMKVSIFRDA